MRRSVAGPHSYTAAIPTLAAVLSWTALSPWAPLEADYLHLKDGRIAAGKFVTVRGADYVFRSGNRTLRAPIAKTRKMVVGYGGAPVCFRLHGGLKDCSGLLFILDEREALIGHYEKDRAGALPSGGWMKSTRVRLDRLASLEFKTRGDGRLPLIRPGVKLRVPGSKKAAVVTGAGRGRLRFRGKDGGESIYEPGARVVAIRLSPPRVVAPAKPTPAEPHIVAWNYFVPGLVQWKRGEKISAGVFMGAFIGLGAAAYQEYRHASRLAAKINRSPVELYFSSLAGGNRAAQASHANLYQGLLSLHLISYALHCMHAAGWWPFSPPAARGGFKPALHSTGFSGAGGTELRFNWEWRF